MFASLEPLLCTSNLSFVKTTRTAPHGEITQATTKIDNPGPATTLPCNGLEIGLCETITDVQEAARSEGQSDTDDKEI